MLTRFLSAMLMAALFFPVPSLASTRYARTATPLTTSVASGSLHHYDSETAAQAHCPSDTIVWLNTRTGIWHEKGMRWYGATREGAYVCRQEASAAGDRDTRNGQ